MKRQKKTKLKKSFFLPKNKKLLVKFYQGDKEEIIFKNLLSINET